MKLRKVTVYVLDLNNPMTDKEIANEFSNMRHVPFTTVGKIESTEIGEWHDRHPLNQKGADHERYFKNG